MIHLILCFVLTVASILLAAMGHLWLAVACGALALVITLRLYRAVRRSHANILTVLQAIENNDHTYYLSENGALASDRRFNETLNRIKLIIQTTREEVRQNELFLTKIIEQVPTGIIITTPRGAVRFINQAALRHLSLPIITHLHRIGQVYPELFDLLSSMTDNDSRSLTIHTEKEARSLVFERTTITIPTGTVHIYSIQDIEDELTRKETDSWMSLIRVMTHEIMNSIAPIRSVSEILLSEMRVAKKDDEATIQAIETIHDTSEGLIRFVEDYRKFSAVPQPQPGRVDVQKLIAGAVFLKEVDFRDKGIEVKVSVADELSALTADTALIMQVLHNLLKNALEATPLGGEVRITAQLNSSRRPTIEVFNTGAPIPDEVKDYIFVPFFTTKDGGSGIGLSLSRYIMRLHGGNLRYRPHTDGVVFVMEF